MKSIRLFRVKLFFLRLARRLRGTCELCGATKTPRNLNDVHTIGPYCRRCNKSRNFFKIYGGGAKKFRDLFMKDGNGKTS